MARTEESTAEYVDTIDALIEDLSEAHTEVGHRCRGTDCPIYAIVLRYSDHADDRRLN